jgi:hypothetical protein
MAYSPSSPVTGGAQTGFTSPTYTLTADKAPDVNGSQWAVTAAGGTQVGVTTHSMSSPFTLTFWKPKIYKLLGKTNPVTGQLTSVPVNVFKEVIRKAVTVLAGQPTRNASITRVFEVPAGSDTVDAPNLRAMCSLSAGVATQLSAGVGDTLVSGIV